VGVASSRTVPKAFVQISKPVLSPKKPRGKTTDAQKQKMASALGFNLVNIHDHMKQVVVDFWENKEMDSIDLTDLTKEERQVVHECCAELSNRIMSCGSRCSISHEGLGEGSEKYLRLTKRHRN